MKVSDLVRTLEAWAPTRYAEGWDNVGLLVGDPDAPVRKVATLVDLTQATAEEILAAGVDFLLAYHPPIFAALKRIDGRSPVGRLLRAGVAIYSPHSALDVASGGTNDVLADLLGLVGRVPIRPHVEKSAEYKLVTFVPAEAVAKVSEAIFRAGAGRIGRYSSCSFRSEGIGTFYGEEGASPVVGAAGRLEEAKELRLETVVPRGRVDAVVAALRASHPYEEPAFDLVTLAAPPSAGGLGLGRIGDLPAAASREEIVARVQAALGVAHVLVAGPTTGEAKRVAVAAGSCGDLVLDAAHAGAQVYVTGELRHHEAREAVDGTGLTVIAVLHSNSERAAVRRFGERLVAAHPGLELCVPASDRDPFRVV